MDTTANSGPDDDGVVHLSPKEYVGMFAQALAPATPEEWEQFRELMTALIGKRDPSEEEPAAAPTPVLAAPAE